MSFIETTYNINESDPNKIRINFQDIINGLSDGTKDINIGGLTASTITAGDVTATTALVANTISERTAGSGITIDGYLLKDGVGTISSGTYEPTLTNGTNVAASAAKPANWIRIGNIVTVTGTLLIDPTSANTLTQLSISLPIASNLAGNECGGVASNDLGKGWVEGMSTDVMRISCQTTSDANAWWGYTFSYPII